MGQATARLYISLIGNIDPLSKSLAQAGSQIDRFGRKIENIGINFSKISVPFAAGIGGALAKFGEFEKSMNAVSALGGIVGADFAKLTKQAEDLGAQTQYSAKQAADAMGVLAQAGLDANQIFKVTPQVLNLAGATNVSLAESADLVSNAIGQFGLKAEDSARIVDVMAQAANAGNLSLTDLGESFKYAGNISSSLGFSIEETAAVMALLSQSGIKATQSGTGFKSGLLSLIKPTSQARDALKEYSIEVTNTEGRLLSLGAILDQFKNNVPKADLEKSLGAVFGKEALPTWIALVQGGSSALDEFNKKLDESAGSAEKARAIMQAGLAGAWENFTGSVEGAGIAIGKAFEPLVQDVLSSLTTLTNGVKSAVDAFQKLPIGVQYATTAMAGAVAVAGPLALALGATVTAGAAALKGFSLLTAGLLGSSGAVTTLTTALTTGGLSSLFAGLTSVVGGFGTVLSSLPALFSPVSVAIVSLGVVFAGLYNNWSEVSNAIIALTQGMVVAVENLIGVNFKAVFIDTFDAITAYAQQFVQGISAVFEAVGHIIPDALTGAAAAFAPEQLKQLQTIQASTEARQKRLLQVSKDIKAHHDERRARGANKGSNRNAGSEGVPVYTTGDVDVEGKKAAKEVDRVLKSVQGSVGKSFDSISGRTSALKDQIRDLVHAQDLDGMNELIAVQGRSTEALGDLDVAYKSTIKDIDKETKATQKAQKSKSELLANTIKQIGASSDLSAPLSANAGLLQKYISAGNIQGIKDIVAATADNADAVKQLSIDLEAAGDAAEGATRQQEAMFQEVASGFSSIASSLGGGQLSGQWGELFTGLFTGEGETAAGELGVNIGGALGDAWDSAIGLFTDSASGSSSEVASSIGQTIGKYGAVISDGIAMLATAGKEGGMKAGEGIGFAVGAGIGVALGGGPVGAQLGGQIGSALGGWVDGLFGTTNAQQKIRNAAGKFVESALKETGAAFISATGKFEAFGGNLITGDGKQFNENIGWAAESVANFGNDAMSVFGAVGTAIATLVGDTDNLGGQIGRILAENFAGNIDNARLLVQQLGLDQEEALSAMIKLAQEGTISWHEYNVQVAGLSEAFGDGLVAVGAFGDAFKYVIESGGRGQKAVISFRNVAIEALEGGLTSIEDLKARLLADGYSEETVTALIQAAAQRGITSLKAWADASDAQAGSIVGDMQVLSGNLNTLWQNMSSTLTDIQSKIADIPDKQVKSLVFEVKIDDPSKVLEGKIQGAQLTTTPITTTPVQKFARGGVLKGPMHFPMSGGLGLAGEAGPEGILPLKRINGRLGVIAQGAGRGDTTIIVNAQGAEIGVEARIRKEITHLERSIIDSAVEAASIQMSRGGGFRRAF